MSFPLYQGPLSSLSQCSSANSITLQTFWPWTHAVLRPFPSKMFTASSSQLPAFIMQYASHHVFQKMLKAVSEALYALVCTWSVHIRSARAYLRSKAGFWVPIAWNPLAIDCPDACFDLQPILCTSSNSYPRVYRGKVEYCWRTFFSTSVLGQEHVPDPTSKTWKPRHIFKVLLLIKSPQLFEQLLR